MSLRVKRCVSVMLISRINQKYFELSALRFTQDTNSTAKSSLCGLIIAPMIVGILVAARSFQFQELAVETERMTVPTVEVVHPQPGPSETEVTLPGNLSPYSEASLYARTDGYLKAWHTDLGAKVSAGQLMAEISAPDVDAQLNQSKANLAQTQANLRECRFRRRSLRGDLIHE